jgi:hypothetical protein
MNPFTNSFLVKPPITIANMMMMRYVSTHLFDDTKSPKEKVVVIGEALAFLYTVQFINDYVESQNQKIKIKK